MAEIIKFVAYGGAILFVFVIAIGASHVGDIIDNVSWGYGRMASLLLYAGCFIIITAAMHRDDLMYQNVDGLNGFRVYWLYAFVAACIPVIGTARVAGFITTFVFVFSMGSIIYG